jgi:hypothetical protein
MKKTTTKMATMLILETREEREVELSIDKDDGLRIRGSRALVVSRYLDRISRAVLFPIGHLELPSFCTFPSDASSKSIQES